MGDIEDIVQDMDSVDNWDDLERIFLEEERYGLFDNFEKFHKIYRLNFSIILGAIYGAVYPNEGIKIINEPLPATIVNKEIKYFLHGIIHDCLNTDVVKNYLLDKKNVVCEPKLKSNYELINSKAQTRADEIKFCNLNYWYTLDFLKYLKSKLSFKKSNIPDFKNYQVGLKDVIDENFFYIGDNILDTRFVN